MRRYCILQQVNPEFLEEYKEAHAVVWPEMLHALKDSGWHNYSLFLRPDGLLIGYVESPDLEAAQEAMARTEVNARWQAAMSKFFVNTDANPDEAFVAAEEVFNLEDQLSRSASPHQTELQPD